MELRGTWEKNINCLRIVQTIVMDGRLYEVIKNIDEKIIGVERRLDGLKEHRLQVNVEVENVAKRLGEMKKARLNFLEELVEKDVEAEGRETRENSEDNYDEAVVEAFLSSVLEFSENAALSGRVLLRASSFDSHTMHYPLLGGDGRISKDRRRFVVLSFFDFMLVMLLWFICTVSSGMDIGDAFIKEIDIFKETFMKESLFDVVLIVALRMIVLMVCYGALRFTTWVPVAVTTGFSSAYLLIKVIFFFSHKSSVTLPQYLIVLASFIVAWVELWFMPFRVLPRERHAQELAEVTSVTSSRPTSITRPVIPFSDDEFRSALEFSSSEEEENASTSTAAAAAKGKKGSKASYIKAACTAQERTTRMLSTAVTWRALRPHDPVVRQSDSGAFYVRSTFPVTPKELWEAVWVRNLEWNDQVLDAKEVLKVDDRTCLFYSVSAPAMRGYIASRDFLDVRRVDAEPELGEYSGYFMSVDSHLLPPNTNKKIVRGTNGPSVMRVYAAGEDNASSTLEWIMQTDLKGGLPKRVVQANMLTFFVNNMTRLRAYLARPH